VSAQTAIAVPDQIDFDREMCKRGLRHYVRRAWHVVEPSKPFIPGWHIDAVCEHLEACSRGEIKRLIINQPPGTMKSLTTAVFWPTWIWGPQDRPESRWLCASYSQELATRDSLKSRRIISSEWYQARWGDRFTLTSDQNQKTKFENDRTGYRNAIGIGGTVTGERGDFLLLDDPHNAKDRNSEASLNAAAEFWTGTWQSRGNDPKTAVFVVIMQRLHARDITGLILEQEDKTGASDWAVLCLPNEYEPTTYISPLGWRDPRTKPNELLCPAIIDEKATAFFKATMGDQYAGQYEQRPAPKGGLTFKREHFGFRYPYLDRAYKNRTRARFLSFDTASSESESAAWTAMTVTELLDDSRLTLRYAERRHVSFPDLQAWSDQLIRSWNADEKLNCCLIENKSSGISLIQTLRRALPKDLARYIQPYEPHGDKETRASAASVWCANGSVILPEMCAEAHWLPTFERELFTFPNCAFKDYVDCFSQIIDYLVNILEEGLRHRMGG